MYAIRIVGLSWYQFHDSYKCMTGADLQKATFYKTREEAERVALLVAVKFPQWMGKLRINKIKVLRIQKIMVEREGQGKTQKTYLWPEEVDHYVTA